MRHLCDIISIKFNLIAVENMKITEKLKTNKQLLSFEVFPPKTDAAFESIENSVRQIAALKPDFMSVTYGAGGGTSEYTVKIASMIKNELDTTALAHLTCASTPKEDISNILGSLKAAKVDNVLALRGDLPENFESRSGDYYKYASELVTAVKNAGDFSVGGACYPEGHPESRSLDEDIEHLKNKVDCGADFLITQLFFDNDIFYSFMDKALKKGICVPVIAGIMPITSIKQIDRICALSGTEIPDGINAFLSKYKDEPDSIAKAGLDFAIKQIDALYANGVAGVHIYTMNKLHTAQTILNSR